MALLGLTGILRVFSNRIPGFTNHITAIRAAHRWSMP
jgi:hypothetical protein